MRVQRLIAAGMASLAAIVLVLGALILPGAQALTLTGPAAEPAADCGSVSCTAYLPAVFRNYPPPANLEITQGVQQPDSSVALVADRKTFVRATITSTAAHTSVSAWLYGEREGLPLPGSPLAALNNPRTLQATANRGVLNDTFNFQLPASWLSGDVALHTFAANGATFTASSGVLTAQFVPADPLNVKIVPVNYGCSSGGSGSTLPADAPYAYLTDFTYHTYPVPSVATTIHSPLAYDGPCTSGGVPNPTFTDWDAMLNSVTTVWVSEGSPDSYYYALLKVYCGGGCIAGIGWIGYSKAAVGFDGTNASHNGASQTHAHEVGHNHGRRHAPGCGASGADSSFPYTSGGKGYIGDGAHPNYGFNIDSLALYPYSAYVDFMSYCSPEWVSDYTYQALLAWNQTHRAEPPLQADRVFLVSGSVASDGRVAFDPVYALDAIGSASVPAPGEYTLEILDAAGRVLAAYPFATGDAVADRWHAGEAYHTSGFHLALPAIDGAVAIRARRGSAIMGAIETAGIPVTLRALGSADGRSTRLRWAASGESADRLRYLVRASTDGGATWQTIGVHLPRPAVDLAAAGFGSRAVIIDVQASDGLPVASLRLGPIVPGR